MAENISSQYTNLFKAQPARNAAPALPGAASDVLPPLPNDRVMLTSAAANAPAANATATATGDMRNELLALQADMQRINRQVEAMIARLEAQQGAQPGPASVPPATNAPAPAAVPTTYQAQAGDYLWKIAKEQLGDANRWTEIYELNKDTIGDNPNLLYPGQTLKLPAGQAPRPGSTAPGQANWPPAQPTFPPAPNFPPLNAPPANLPATNFPPALPPTMPPMLPPSMPPALPPQNFPPPANFPPQNFPPQNVPPQNMGVTDVPLGGPSNRQLSDQDALRLAQEFGLAPAGSPMSPQLKANVALFLDEMDSYETSNKGKVFGPGMEALAANPTEVQQIRNSVMQIQQALDILLRAGRIRVNDAQGRPVTQLPATGSFFQVDAQGREVRGPNGAPVMNEAFVAAITQFKQNQGIHQNYRLADGTFGINEYVGPATVEALKKALTDLQAGR